MRIIGGKARGTKLFTLEGKNTRPTLDRVKESLFNIIQREIVESNFLDVFAGSGAIGLEAASRGAKKVIMCDNSKEAINIINKNIEKTHLKEKIELYNCDFENTISNIKENTIDIIYLDPPYKTQYIKKALNQIKNSKWINCKTKIIIETDDEKRIIEEIQDIKNFKIIDTRKYGRVDLIFLVYEKVELAK